MKIVIKGRPGEGRTRLLELVRRHLRECGYMIDHDPFRDKEHVLLVEAPAPAAVEDGGVS
jgi:hypothetical protein